MISRNRNENTTKAEGSAPIKALKRTVRRTYRLLRLIWAYFWPLRGRFYRSFNAGQPSDNALNTYNLFFIHGSGRSGTQMLSGLLDHDETSLVLHEPAFFEDRLTRNAVRKSKTFCKRYLLHFRLPFIASLLRSAPKSIETYGEVTGTLRYHSAVLHELHPGAQCLIIARDGRDVVRSIMQRDFYTSTSSMAGDTSPLPGDQLYKKWDELTRFERTCWLWADSYRELLSAHPDAKVIHFEKVLESYSYCEEHLFKPLGLSIDHETWIKHVSQKSKNATPKHKFSSWNEWTPEQKSAFQKICDAQMLQLGYDV